MAFILAKNCIRFNPWTFADLTLIINDAFHGQQWLLSSYGGGYGLRTWLCRCEKNSVMIGRVCVRWKWKKCTYVYSVCVCICNLVLWWTVVESERALIYCVPIPEDTPCWWCMDLIHVALSLSCRKTGYQHSHGNHHYHHQYKLALLLPLLMLAFSASLYL